MELRFPDTEFAFKAHELTLDSFLGGAVRAFQPRRGYRAGLDSVMLAAAVPAEPRQSVLELGCGVGVSILCLCRRVTELSAAGLEILPEYADLARRNSEAAGQGFDIFLGSVASPPSELKRMNFNHVMANPPFFPADEGLQSPDGGRRSARHESVSLESWVDCALRRLRPEGELTMILPPGRFPEFMSAIRKRAGAMDVKPLYPRIGRPASRFLIRARKGARAPLRFASPLVLHEVPNAEDGEAAYGEIAEALLRSPAALEFWP